MHLRMHTDCIQSAYKHIKSKEERNSSSTSSYTVRSSIFYCLCLRAIIFYCPCLRAFTDSIRPHCPFIRIRVAATFGGYGRPPAHATCMHCMHQKTDYACYARTQLRKRLHTMHTRRQFGSGVGLRARKCMHLRMHTDCIQSAYKHIKRGKERILPSTSSFILSVFIFYCLCLQAIKLHRPRFQACTTPPDSPLRPRKNAPPRKAGRFALQAGIRRCGGRGSAGGGRSRPASCRCRPVR